MFELPELPFDKSALEPYMGTKTLEFHYGKHHQTYVNNLNDLTNGTPMANMDLEEVIVVAANDSTKAAIFNNAAQVYNHNFFWRCMRKGGGGDAPEKLKKALEKSFGSLEKFKEEFKAAAVSQFGSGWAWLVSDGGELKIMKTSNADNPVAHGKKPLLTIDVWEHAYYLDFQNRRTDFVQGFLDNLVDWGFVERNL